ncbi:hypothetical protein AB833_30965 [Chromatiales bacterium (ex Bugula neritina AB1)]|nr:hypothetical protein AB833_30965 [Chromatiales bacterium (ex Bugula neritina AB1)]
MVLYENVVKIMCEHCGCTEAEILKTKRGRHERNVSRWMAMKLTQEKTEITSLELAEGFQVAG